MDEVAERLTQPPSKMKRRRFAVLSFDGWLQAHGTLDGARFEGYEMHMGRTDGAGLAGNPKALLFRTELGDRPSRLG